MPRKTKARRFEPRYGVSEVTLQVEANHVAREVEDYEVLAVSDLDAKRTERHVNCEHSWKHLNMLLEGLADQKQRIIHCLLFRDFHQLLELYLTYVRATEPQSTVIGPPQHREPKPSQFSEWLFDPA